MFYGENEASHFLVYRAMHYIGFVFPFDEEQSATHGIQQRNWHSRLNIYKYISRKLKRHRRPTTTAHTIICKSTHKSPYHIATTYVWLNLSDDWLFSLPPQPNLCLCQAKASRAKICHIMFQITLFRIRWYTAASRPCILATRKAPRKWQIINLATL